MFLNNKINLKIIFFILILLLMKIVLGFFLESSNPDFFFTPDSATYINSAKEICETGKFNDIDKLPEIKRTPGTSFFLLPAVCFDINLKIYIIFLNSLMLLLSAYYTFKTVILMNIKVSPLLIFFIFLIDPTLTRYQYTLLPEIIFLFWISLALYFFIHGLKNYNFFYLFFGFLTLTLVTFVKPIILYLPYYLFICFILFYSLNSLFRSKFKNCLLLASFLGLIVHFSVTQLWTYRNYELTGVKEFTYIKAVNSYYYMTAGIVAKSKKTNFEEVQKEFFVKTENFSKNELVDYSKTEFKKTLIKYPLEAIIVGLEGSLMTFFTPGTGQYARMFNVNDKNYHKIRNIFIFIGFLWIFIMSFFAILGIIKIRKNIFILLIILVFVYLLLLSSGPMSYSRFRVPFIPIIVIFISCGFQSFIKNIKTLKFKNISKN